MLPEIQSNSFLILMGLVNKMTKNKPNFIVYVVQVYNEDYLGWHNLSAYGIMQKKKAREIIKKLRAESKRERWGKRYRIQSGYLVPK